MNKLCAHNHQVFRTSLNTIAAVCMLLPAAVLSERGHAIDTAHALIKQPSPEDSFVAQGYEQELISILDLIQSNQIDRAHQLLDDHLAKYPTSRVAQLLKSDLYLAEAGEPMMLTTAKSHGDTEARVKLEGLKGQLKYRWKHQQQDGLAHEYVPDSLLYLGDHEYVFVADLKDGRFYVYQNTNGRPQLVKDYYMTVGSEGFGKQVEGDNKTPVGVYNIYRHIDGKELPDLYGEGAYPVDYPNRVDRFRKRTGYGIWLHGTPSDTVARAPWASEGCFVLSNEDMVDIAKYIDPASRPPVVLSDGINWISKSQLQQQSAEHMKVVEQWRQDWESMSLDNYVRHYQRSNFNFGRDSYSKWVKRKKAIGRNKTFVQIDLDIDSIFAYPGEQDMFVVKFRQHYLSNNYQSTANKEQYWQKDAKTGQWKIAFEG